MDATERLRTARAESGMTIGEIASKMRVSERTYRRWEEDLSRVPVSKVLLLHDCLSVPRGAIGLLRTTDLIDAIHWRCEHMDDGELRRTLVHARAMSAYMRGRLGLPGPLDLEVLGPADDRPLD